MSDRTTRVAEAVLPGHPDKLADAIADALVDLARRRDERALVGVEVAIHRKVVFIDGRVACPDAQTIDFKKIASDVYRSAGYAKSFAPNPTRLRIVKDLCLDPLTDDERELRGIADDQSVVTGYACSTPGDDYLPVEQAVALRLCRALYKLRWDRADLRLGPDGKLLVYLDEWADGRRFQLREVCVSVQHSADWDAIAARDRTDLLRRAKASCGAGSGPGRTRSR